MRIVDNPLGILTNAYNFERQLEQLNDYVTFTPAFLAGKVAPNTPRVTTGNFSGKKKCQVVPTRQVPGLSEPLIIRKRRTSQRRSGRVISEWHLLNSVTVPKLTEYQRNYSIYRAATVTESLTYYFEPYNRLGLVKLQLTEAMLTWQEPRFYGAFDELLTNSLN